MGSDWEKDSWQRQPSPVEGTVKTLRVWLCKERF